jgi:hypothetical protein
MFKRASRMSHLMQQENWLPNSPAVIKALHPEDAVVCENPKLQNCRLGGRVREKRTAGYVT